MKKTKIDLSEFVDEEGNLIAGDDPTLRTQEVRGDSATTDQVVDTAHAASPLTRGRSLAEDSLTSGTEKGLVDRVEAPVLRKSDFWELVKKKGEDLYPVRKSNG